MEETTQLGRWNSRPPMHIERMEGKQIALKTQQNNPYLDIQSKYSLYGTRIDFHNYIHRIPMFIC